MSPNPALLTFSRRAAPSGWTPADFGTDLAGWWDAADASTLTLDGSQVTDWADKSSVGMDVSQAVVANRPSVSVHTQNGLDVISFSSASHVLSRAGSFVSEWQWLHEGAEPHIIAAVARKDAIGNMGLFSTRRDGSSSPSGTWLYMNGETMWPIYTNGSGGQVATLQSSNYVKTGVPFVHSQLVDLQATASSRIVLYKNAALAPGVSTAPANVDAVTDVLPLCIGNLHDTSGLYGMTGWVAEIVLVKGSSATEANRAILASYLMDKWGIDATPTAEFQLLDYGSRSNNPPADYFSWTSDTSTQGSVWFNQRIDDLGGSTYDGQNWLTLWPLLKAAGAMFGTIEVDGGPIIPLGNVTAYEGVTSELRFNGVTASHATAGTLCTFTLWSV